jgi:hypothetical protein
MVRPAGPETAGPQADPRRMRENYGFFSTSTSAPSERARREPGSASTRSPSDHRRCSSLTKEPTILFSILSMSENFSLHQTIQSAS